MDMNKFDTYGIEEFFESTRIEANNLAAMYIEECLDEEQMSYVKTESDLEHSIDAHFDFLTEDLKRYKYCVIDRNDDGYYPDIDHGVDLDYGKIVEIVRQTIKI